jgi:hypothetical protein
LIQIVCSHVCTHESCYISESESDVPIYSESSICVGGGRAPRFTYQDLQPYTDDDTCLVSGMFEFEDYIEQDNTTLNLSISSGLLLKCNVPFAKL